MPIETCACGDRADNACNDCEQALCDNCAAPDMRCFTCAGAYASASNLFDDPETASLEDDEECDEDRSGESDMPDDDDWDLSGVEV
jgi:hypothetical protein